MDYIVSEGYMDIIIGMDFMEGFYLGFAFGYMLK